MNVYMSDVWNAHGFRTHTKIVKTVKEKTENDEKWKQLSWAEWVKKRNFFK